MPAFVLGVEQAVYAQTGDGGEASERSDDVIADVEAGLITSGRKRGVDYRVIPDRAEAIRETIAMARPGDLVMIAGKGHEDYQIIGARRIHFDDREVARAVLEAR